MPGSNQLVVQLAWHGRDDAMLNDRIFRGGEEFPDVLKPGFGNAPFAFVVAQLRRCGAGAVLVEENQAVKETCLREPGQGFLSRRSRQIT